MVMGTQIAQTDTLSIKKDLSSLVKQYFHWPLTEDFQRKLITHGIYTLNLTAQDGALSFGRGRQGGQITCRTFRL
jgi:hypothetical protein